MYLEEGVSGAIIRKSNALDTAEVLTAAAAVYGGYLITQRIQVNRVMFYVTVTTASNTQNPVVAFKRRPTYNSASGEVTMGTLTIPTGTAAGKVMYKDIDPFILYPGDEFSFEQTVQATDSGSAAGAGFYAFFYQLDPEVPSNEGDMIKSV